MHQLRRRLLVDLLRAMHRQHDPVAIPIREEVHRSGDEEGDHRAIRSPDQVADSHEQGCQPGEQNCCP